MAEEAGGPGYSHPFGQPVTQVVLDALAEPRIVIGGDEHHHLARSLRLRPGDSFVATDGRGTVARLVIEHVERRELVARVEQRAAVPPPSRRLWLAAGAEAGRGDWLVEKAAELGAWAFLPHVAPDRARRERWGRLARAALKQSLGAWAMRIEVERPALEAARDAALAGAWIGLPGGADPLAQSLPPQGDWLLVCGPPGGFEEAALGAWTGLPGAVAVRLGGRRLRAETAALALLTAARLRIESIVETA